MLLLILKTVKTIAIKPRNNIQGAVNRKIYILLEISKLTLPDWKMKIKKYLKKTIKVDKILLEKIKNKIVGYFHERR